MQVSAASGDALVHALYAAELGVPFEIRGRARLLLLDELFASLPQLRDSVPYATVRLLERLGEDPRAEVRIAVAQSLAWFADLYDPVCDELALRLAHDRDAGVREAAAKAIAASFR